MLDLDEFKSVNDLHGHQAGDSVLAQVGQRIQAYAREVDTAARLGGDEFAILLEDVLPTISIPSRDESSKRLRSPSTSRASR